VGAAGVETEAIQSGAVFEMMNLNAKVAKASRNGTPRTTPLRSFAENFAAFAFNLFPS
jgi:hypothetical protein